MGDMMHDNQSDVLGCVSIDKMKFAPKSPFNVISLSKLQRQSLKLHGEEEYTAIVSKEGFVLRFDIVIHTDDGVVYAMYIKPDKVDDSREVLAPAVTL